MPPASRHISESCPRWWIRCRHQLARIYTLTGEQEKALDRLERILTRPYYLSPGWLRIDPTFDPLRSNPRFKRLVEGQGSTSPK